MNSSTENISKLVLDRRIRNRRIEVLELTSSFESQREYQRNVPIAQVPAEVINQWGDWSNNGDLDWEPFNPEVYTPEEASALREYNAAWHGALKKLPDALPSIEDVQLLPAWIDLRIAASEALAVLMTRGTLPED